MDVCVFEMVGPAGSGKSTIAKQLTADLTCSGYRVGYVTPTEISTLSVLLSFVPVSYAIAWRGLRLITDMRNKKIFFVLRKIFAGFCALYIAQRELSNYDIVILDEGPFQKIHTISHSISEKQKGQLLNFVYSNRLIRSSRWIPVYVQCSDIIRYKRRVDRGDYDRRDFLPPSTAQIEIEMMQDYGVLPVKLVGTLIIVSGESYDTSDAKKKILDAICP